eukprot:gene3501-2452_t
MQVCFINDLVVGFDVVSLEVVHGLRELMFAVLRFCYGFGDISFYIVLLVTLQSLCCACKAGILGGLGCCFGQLMTWLYKWFIVMVLPVGFSILRFVVALYYCNLNLHLVMIIGRVHCVLIEYWFATGYGATLIVLVIVVRTGYHVGEH